MTHFKYRTALENWNIETKGASASNQGFITKGKDYFYIFKVQYDQKEFVVKLTMEEV